MRYPDYAGFMPKRGEFETEWNNDAEMMVADLTWYLCAYTEPNKFFILCPGRLMILPRRFNWNTMHCNSTIDACRIVLRNGILCSKMDWWNWTRYERVFGSLAILSSNLETHDGMITNNSLWYNRRHQWRINAQSQRKKKHWSRRWGCLLKCSRRHNTRNSYRDFSLKCY